MNVVVYSKIRVRSTSGAMALRIAGTRMLRGTGEEEKMVRSRRKRVREVAEICLLCVLVIGACSHARRRDRGDERTQGKSGASASAQGPDEERRAIPGTFLDTTNSGREVALREEDLADATETEQAPAGHTQRRSAPAKRTAPARKRSAGAPPPQPQDVYRIQCIASTQADAMEQAKKKLESRVTYPVFVMFVDPYYKLLVGEFASRTDAERALFEVRGHGYPDAWIVKGTGRSSR